MLGHPRWLAFLDAQRGSVLSIAEGLDEQALRLFRQSRLAWLQQETDAIRPS